MSANHFHWIFLLNVISVPSVSWTFLRNKILRVRHKISDLKHEIISFSTPNLLFRNEKNSSTQRTGNLICFLRTFFLFVKRISFPCEFHTRVQGLSTTQPHLHNHFTYPYWNARMQRQHYLFNFKHFSVIKILFN